MSDTLSIKVREIKKDIFNVLYIRVAEMENISRPILASLLEERERENYLSFPSVLLSPVIWFLFFFFFLLSLSVSALSFSLYCRGTEALSMVLWEYTLILFLWDGNFLHKEEEEADIITAECSFLGFSALWYSLSLSLCCAVFYFLFIYCICSCIVIWLKS